MMVVSKRRMLFRLCTEVRQPAAAAWRGSDDLPNWTRHNLPVQATSLEGIDAVFGNPRAWIGLALGLGLCGTGLAYI